MQNTQGTKTTGGGKTPTLNSMTGYAVMETLVDGQKFRLHLKSVNHRFFELRWKSPRAWLSFEAQGRSLLQKTLERGSIDFWVEDLSLNAGEESGARDFFIKLQSALNETDGLSEITLPIDLRATLLSRFPDLWWKQKQEASFNADDLKLAVTELAAQLATARQVEGEGIRSTLMGYAQDLALYYGQIRAVLPQIKDLWEQDYKIRLEKVAEELRMKAPSEERIMQEWLMLAERREVSEELQRIDSHLEALRGLLDVPKANMGKRLEFLTQELHREWTTLGNKIHNAAQAQIIIEAKLSIEKIREQTLNIA